MTLAQPLCKWWGMRACLAAWPCSVCCFPLCSTPRAKMAQAYMRTPGRPGMYTSCFIFCIAVKLCGGLTDSCRMKFVLCIWPAWCKKMHLLLLMVPCSFCMFCCSFHVAKVSLVITRSMHVSMLSSSAVVGQPCGLLCQSASATGCMQGTL